MSKEDSDRTNAMVMYDHKCDEIFFISRVGMGGYDVHGYEWKVDTIDRTYYAKLNIDELLRAIENTEFLGEL